MNKKGFTLTELLAVIVIIGLISIIVIPIVDNSLKESREELYKTQIKNMEDGLRNWGANNLFNLPGENETITLTLAQLKQLGYLDKDIENPKTKKPFPNDMLFTISNNGGILVYEVLLDTGTTGNNDINSEYAPILILNGSPYETVEYKETYIEKGVSATTYSGSQISSDQISRSISGGAIDTNILNSEYTITYETTDNGITTKVIRTVKVKDTTPPVIILPEGVMTIDKTEVSTFNLMAGVSATDNSGVTPEIKVSGSLSTISGNYAITYTATDTSGNTSTLKRVIVVSGQIPSSIELTDGTDYTIFSNYTYQDPGYKIYDISGILISEYDKVTITNPFANMTKPYAEGIYDVVYSVKNDKGKEIVKATRKVKVISSLEFSYTGNEQSVKLIPGTYKLEVWGAQGGSLNDASYYGGPGGYSVGAKTFDQTTTVYINVGGVGTSGNGIALVGGYNGGGSVIANGWSSYSAASGGGATHIATKSGILSSLSSYTSNILIVGAGGGGSRIADSCAYSRGGAGGGYLGSSASSGSVTGGNQTAGGSSSTTGIFGKGADVSNGCAGAGGGGWYGGGASTSCCGYGGGGGSGYIGGVDTSAIYGITREMFCYSCSTSTTENIKTSLSAISSEIPIEKTAKKVNGYAKITYLGP